MKTYSLLALLTLLLLPPAYGDAYKCRRPDGRTEISSDPCAAGSKTLKEVEDEKISEENRLRAERDVERQREFVDKSEQSRLAREQQERDERERAEKQRLAAEARNRASQPVYVPLPTYVGPGYGYVRPPLYPNQPLPPSPSPKPGKPVDLYKVPSSRGR